MRCIAQSNQEPSPIQIERREKLYDVWLRQNIHEVTVENPEDAEAEAWTYWEYDEAYMQTIAQPEITLENLAEWFTTAEAWAEPEVDQTVTAEDLLLELAADHEERICMLELMTEV